MFMLIGLRATFILKDQSLYCNA